MNCSRLELISAGLLANSFLFFFFWKGASKCNWWLSSSSRFFTQQHQQVSSFHKLTNLFSYGLGINYWKRWSCLDWKKKPWFWCYIKCCLSLCPPGETLANPLDLSHSFIEWSQQGEVQINLETWPVGLCSQSSQKTTGGLGLWGISWLHQCRALLMINSSEGRFWSLRTA